LITASRSGDAAAYDTLYRRHAAAARTLARQLVRWRAEADDVVAETFAKILDLLRRGGGPEGAFRPYLLTAVRRAAYDRHRAERRQFVTDQMDAFDPGVPFADPAVADLERTMIARAFASLPQRWQAVLWHTEIEGARPAEVATLLGLTANGVAALAYRAREGLRQAYLQMHLSGEAREECRPVAAKLGAYVRGGLAKRDAAMVAGHLDQCADCRRIYAELGDVNVALEAIVAPVVLGPAAAAYLASAAGPAAASNPAAARPASPHPHASRRGGSGAPGPASLEPGPAMPNQDAPQPTVKPGAPSQPQAPDPPRSPGQPRPGTPGQPAGQPPAPGAAAQPTGAPVPTGATVPTGAAGSAATPSSPLPAAPSSPPAVAAPPAPGSQLTTQINPVGALPFGGTGIVGFSVTNSGTAPALQVTANVSLPLGVSLMAGGTLGPDSPVRASPGGWTCVPDAAGARCTHGPLAAAASTASYLLVAVAPGAPAGAPPSISVDSGHDRVTARGTSGVSAGGLPARCAASDWFAASARCSTSGWCAGLLLPPASGAVSRQQYPLHPVITAFG
jgi:RNA polymerase sigma factor (sigma-70 family)